MYNLLEALLGIVVDDWSFFLQHNVLNAFEYGDMNCRGQIQLEDLAHYFLPLISFFFESYVGSSLKKCSKLLTKDWSCIIGWLLKCHGCQFCIVVSLTKQIVVKKQSISDIHYLQMIPVRHNIHT
jgi:hypothetical protein